MSIYDYQLKFYDKMKINKSNNILGKNAMNLGTNNFSPYMDVTFQTNKIYIKNTLDSNAYTFTSDTTSELPSAVQGDDNGLEEKFIKIVTQSRNKITGQIITEEKYVIREGIKVTPELLEIKRQLENHTYVPSSKQKTIKKKNKKKSTTKSKETIDKDIIKNNPDIKSADFFASSEDNDPYNDNEIPRQNKRYIKYTEMVKKLKNKKNGNIMRQVFQKTQYTDVPQNPKPPPKEKKFVARKRIFDKPPSPKRFLVKKQTTKYKPFEGSLDIPSDNTFIKIYGSLHAPLKEELDSIPILPKNYDAKGDDLFPSIFLVPTQPVLVKVGKKFYIERMENGIVTRYRATEDGKRVILVKKDENGHKKIKKKKTKKQKSNLDDTRTMTDSKIVDFQTTTETKSTFIMPTDATADNNSSGSFEEAEAQSRTNSDNKHKMVVSTVMANSDDLAPRVELDSDSSTSKPVETRPHGSDSVPRSMISGSSSSDVQVKMTPNMMRRMRNNKKKLRLPPVPPQVLRNTIDKHDEEEDLNELPNLVEERPKEDKPEIKRKTIEFKKIPEGSEKSTSSKAKLIQKDTDSSESEDEENNLLDQLSDSPEGDNFYQPSVQRSDSDSETYSSSRSSYSYSSSKLASPKPSFKQIKQYSSSYGEEEVKRSIVNQTPPPKELPIPEFSENEITITQTLTSSSSGAQSFSSGGSIKIITVKMDDIKKGPIKKAKKKGRARKVQQNKPTVEMNSPRKELQTGGQNIYEHQFDSVELALAEPVSMDFTHTTSSSPFVAEPAPSPRKEKPIAQITQAMDFVKTSSSSEPQAPKPQIVMMDSFEISLQEKEAENEPSLSALLKESQTRTRTRPRRNEKVTESAKRRVRERARPDLNTTQVEPPQLSVSAIKENNIESLSSLLQNHLEERIKNAESDTTSSRFGTISESPRRFANDNEDETVDPPPIQKRPSPLIKRNRPSMAAPKRNPAKFTNRSQTASASFQSSSDSTTSESSDDVLKPLPISRSIGNNSIESLKSIQKKPSFVILSSDSEKEDNPKPSVEAISPAPPLKPSPINSPERKPKLTFQSFTEISQSPTLDQSPSQNEIKSKEVSPIKNMTIRRKIVIESSSSSDSGPKPIPASQIKSPPRRNAVNQESTLEIPYQVFDNDNISSTDYEETTTTTDDSTQSPSKFKTKSKPKHSLQKKSVKRLKASFVALSTSDSTDTLIEGIDDVILIPRYQKSPPKPPEKNNQVPKVIPLPEVEEEESSSITEEEDFEEEEDDFYTTLTTIEEEESSPSMPEDEYSEHEIFNSDSSKLVIDYSNEGSEHPENPKSTDFAFSPVEKNREIVSPRGKIPFSPSSFTSEGSPKNNQKVIWPMEIKKRPPKPPVVIIDTFPKEEPKVEEEYIPKAPSLFLSTTKISSVHKIEPKKKEEKKIVKLKDILQPQKPGKTKSEEESEDELTIELKKQEDVRRAPKLSVDPEKAKARRAKHSSPKRSPIKKGFIPIADTSSVKNDNSSDRELPVAMMQPMVSVRSLERLQVNNSVEEPIKISKGKLPKIPKKLRKKIETDSTPPKVHRMEIVTQKVESIPIEPIKEENKKLQKVSSVESYDSRPGIRRRAIILSSDDTSESTSDEEDEEESSTDGAPFSQTHSSKHFGDSESTSEEESELEVPNTPPKRKPQNTNVRSRKQIVSSSSSSSSSSYSSSSTPDDSANLRSGGRKSGRRVRESTDPDSDEVLIPPKPEKKALSVGIVPIQSSTEDSEEQYMHASAQWGSRISNPSTPKQEEETSSSIPAGFDEFLEAKGTESSSGKDIVRSDEALLHPATAEYEYTNSDSPILNAPQKSKKQGKKAPPNPFKRERERIKYEEEDEEYDSDIPTTIDDTIDERRMAQNAGVQFQIKQRRLLYGGIDADHVRKEKPPIKDPKRAVPKPALPFASMLSSSDSESS